jgi:hypothetical protein
LKKHVMILFVHRFQRVKSKMAHFSRHF